eukprot:scaffold6388_cov103-Isochrysis_galbana.AAC.2
MGSLSFFDLGSDSGYLLYVSRVVAAKDAPVASSPQNSASSPPPARSTRPPAPPGRSAPMAPTHGGRRLRSPTRATAAPCRLQPRRAAGRVWPRPRHRRPRRRPRPEIARAARPADGPRRAAACWKGPEVARAACG